MQSHSVHPLETLRAQIRAIEASGLAVAAERLPFGVEAVDAKLGGGLATAALHEVSGASGSLGDDAAATLFSAGIAARLKGMVLWVLQRRDLFAPALDQAGLPPGRLLYAECGNDDEALAVIEEGLRHGSLGGVVGEVGRITIAAARRLQLAAETSGTMALLLRRWRKTGADPLALPSSAVTRWRIGCAPSRALPVSGIGRPCWTVELVRQRSGAPGIWILEGVDEAGRLALPADAPDRAAAAARPERQIRTAA
jgi:protein ImuA